MQWKFSWMRIAALVVLFGLGVTEIGVAQEDNKPEDSGKVSFANDVGPILVRRCLACHGNQQAKGGFSLETFEAMIRGGNTGESLVPGEPDESNMLLLIENGEMPQDADPLTKDQIELIRRWVSEGAAFDGPAQDAAISTIIPKGIHPPAPESYRVPLAITSLAFKPSGSQLAVGGYHEILVWCRECDTLAKRLGNVAERTYALEFSSDGKLLASGSGTPAQIGEVKLWNPKTGELVKDLLTTSDSVFCVSFSPDGKRLAAGGADRAIRIWNVETGEQELLIEDHTDWVMGVAWSPDGKKLASASRDKTSKVFDASNGDSLVTFPGHGEPVFGVSFGPEGKQVATAGRDKQVRLWNPEDGKEIRAIGRHGNEIYNVIFLTDGPTLYTTSADQTVRQFNPGDGKQIRVLEGHKDHIYSASYSAQSRLLATGDWRGEVRIWNLEDGTVVDSFIAAPGYKEQEQLAQSD